MHAAPAAAAPLSSLRLPPARFLQRYAVTTPSGEEMVLTFELALEDSLQAKYRWTCVHKRGGSSHEPLLGAPRAQSPLPPASPVTQPTHPSPLPPCLPLPLPVNLQGCAGGAQVVPAGGDGGACEARPSSTARALLGA